MSLYWKMHTTFPFTRVFVLGIILFFLGLASMIISVIAFVTQSWGHYVGTGMWGGAMILASGLTAIFVSRLKSLASVKAFLICSVVAMFTSLAMLILSAGGLTLSSRFYSRMDPTEYNKRTSNLIHASLLVISVFCLSGNVLAVIVCSKYLFFEHHDKPRYRRRQRNLSDGSVRTSTALRGGATTTNSLKSTNSRTPLQSNDPSRRHSDNLDVNRVQIEYRRSHRRSASDQPHGNSHSRRQRPSHQDGSHSCNNNSNMLSTCGIRYHPDRRSGSNRGPNQGQEMRGDSKERDRLNIVPHTHRQGSNRPYSHGVMQVHLGRNPASASPKIRLPTEFDEEELPPYEAVESSRPQNALNGPGSDSGDESDTENSSSTDAHSYNAEDICGEGAEAVPMVDLSRSQRGRNRRVEQSASMQHQALSSHENRSPHRNIQNENQSERLIQGAAAPNDISRSTSNGIKCAKGAGAMVVRKDSNRSNRPLLSYVNTQPSDHLGDYECLLSVSPEVCAITGESPEPVHGAEGHIPHVVEENFYENGPCYENIRCSDKQMDENTVNPLSRSSVPNTTKVCTNTTYQEQSRDSSPKSSNPARKVPVQVLSHSSPVSNSAPQSPQSSFGSTLSAFRPVGATALSPHSICSPSAQSPLSPHLLEDDHSPHGNGLTLSQLSNNANKQYVDQGAIPKGAKHTETGLHIKDSTNLSWKNIPLPLSYNHSESASNELEKKLPSKTIPFADSKGNTSKVSKKGTSDEKCEPANLSLRVYPSQNSSSSAVPSSSLTAASKSSALPVSPFGAAAEAILSPTTKSNSPMSNESHSSREPPPSLLAGNIMASSVREASTQATSSAPSTRRQFHRMGGNQSLLQSRREELQNSHLSRRSLEMSTRATRPSSMPASSNHSIPSHSASVLASAEQNRNRNAASAAVSAPPDPSHPLSLSSYLVNQPPQNHSPQPPGLRQNHLLHHYPLQPQQPRLGVQLQQRRQQQHQLQQNIESQQQQQQVQQQQLQQGNQQNQPPQQQSRNGRPLFSVLL